MNIRKIVILISFMSVGCTSLEQKTERYRRAADMTSNPERVEVRYIREGDTASFYEQRCSGAMCNEMVIPKPATSFSDGSPRLNTRHGGSVR